KLVDIASRLSNFLEVRDTALAKSSEELEAQIKSILEDVAKVKGLEEESGDKSSKVLKEISSELEQIFQTIRRGIEQEIEAKFKAGKASEKERARSQRKDI
ncbi:TPA: hypothetical protein ACG1SX_007040, partial [Pseudomonas aeruginosa]